MIPKISCQQCNSELTPDDQFCSNCGAKVDWQPASKQVSSGSQSSSLSEIPCPICGQLNPTNVASCQSCGASLRSRDSVSSHGETLKQQDEAHIKRGHRLNFLQSWKMLALIALLLVIVLSIVRYAHKEGPPPGLSQNAQIFMKEVEALQKTIESNPTNEQALLRLANLYYDMRMFARAIMMYDRYLEINPSNPNARVDLGISYFEMALADSVNREQYFTTAKNEMKKALEFNPQHQLAQYNLGMVSLHSGDFEESNQWFQRCAETDSSSEVGKRAQQLIKQHSFTNP